MHLFARFRLAKIWLCLLVGLSTLFGYLMAAGEVSFTGFFLGGGIFLLATGGATLNSYQERLHDSKMQRTNSRPMVIGEFSGTQALLQAFLLLGAGWAVIAYSGSFFAAFFALCGIVLYNFVYTPLKKISIFALFPGAVCGAIPPCVGWIGGGGGMYAYAFWLVFWLFFLWQIPHFWLVMLMHRDDYVGGPYPSLLDRFSEVIIKGFFLPWIGALLVIMMYFPIVSGQGILWFEWTIIINCLVLGMIFVYELGTKLQPNYRMLFIVLNCALIIHMAVVSLAVLIQ